MSNLLAIPRRALHALADALLPQACFVCGAQGAGERVCAACRTALPVQPSACPVCAVPLAKGSVCGHCQRHPPAFDATRACFAYAFPLDRMVQGLKYQQRFALAPFFAQALGALGRPADAALVLPMPLHRKRLRERGFNQAVEIARPLARAWGLPLELSCIARTRHAAPQAGLPWVERQRNVRGVFACAGDARAIAGRTVLVVDDVMTTGATLDELARTLKRHGAARVENLVLARTPPPR